MLLPNGKIFGSFGRISDEASIFSFESGGKYGIADADGNVLANPQYDDVSVTDMETPIILVSLLCQP